MMEPWRSPTQNRSSFINNNFKNSLQLVSNYWTTKAQGIVSDDRLDPLYDLYGYLKKIEN